MYFLQVERDLTNLRLDIGEMELQLDEANCTKEREVCAIFSSNDAKLMIFHRPGRGEQTSSSRARRREA